MSTDGENTKKKKSDGYREALARDTIFQKAP